MEENPISKNELQSDQNERIDLKSNADSLKTIRNKEKAELNQLNMQGTFGTVAEPRKALSTFFRNQNKFEVSGVAILDRKASIVIRICATTISAVIAFNQQIESNVDGGNIISLVLLIGLSASLVFAILATKPSTKGLRKLVKNQVTPIHPDLEENIFYVWDNENLADYEKAMEKVIKSQDLQVGNMIRANFLLGRKNVNSARLIDFSYDAFLFSFVVSGIVFILARYSVI